MVSFTDPHKLAQIFDSDHRQQWQRTDYILQVLNLKSSEVVADVGAGTGYFCQQFLEFTMAKHIYAIDPEPNMQVYLTERFSHEPRLTPRQCGYDNPQLPSDTTTVFMANSYRFIQSRSTFLQQLSAQLPLNARVMIVDYKGNNARVTPEMVISEVIAAGFELYHYDRDSCPDHYILSFRHRNRLEAANFT